MGNNTSEQDYFTERSEKEGKWYAEKAQKNKQRFYVMQTIIIVTAASVSIVNVLRVSDYLVGYVGAVSAIPGGIVMILTALLQLFKNQENWIVYQTTAELLKKEKYFYLNSVGPYSDLNVEQKRNC